MRASNSIWTISKFILFIYFSSWVQGLLVLGYCPTPHVTLLVLYVAPAFQELDRLLFPLSVAHRVSDLKYLWSNNLPPFH